MVSFFGLRLGGDKNSKKSQSLPRGKKLESPLDGSLFSPSFPAAKRGTSHSVVFDGSGRSPYGSLGASLSLVNIRPPAMSIRPSTADSAAAAAAASEPASAFLPGHLSQAGTWPRSSSNLKTSTALGHFIHGSTTSLNLAPPQPPSQYATAQTSRLDAPSSASPRACTPESQLSRDTAGGVFSISARSPLEQIEFNLRQQRSASPISMATAPTDLDEPLAPVMIKDANYSRPPSPAPTKALPHPPLRPRPNHTPIVASSLAVTIPTPAPVSGDILGSAHGAIARSASSMSATSETSGARAATITPYRAFCYGDRTSGADVTIPCLTPSNRGRPTTPTTTPTLTPGQSPRPSAGDQPSPSARSARNPDSIRQGDRILPRSGSAAPHRVLHDVPDFLRPGFGTLPPQRPTTDMSRQTLTADAAKELDIGVTSSTSIPGNMLRPSPFPEPLRIKTSENEQAPKGNPSTLASPPGSFSPMDLTFQSIRRNRSAPDMQQRQEQQHQQQQPGILHRGLVTSKDSPISSSSNEQLPKLTNETTPLGLDRFSLTSSVYSSDSGSSTLERSSSPSPSPSSSPSPANMPTTNQKVIQPGGAEMMRLMQFDFGFGSAI